MKTFFLIMAISSFFIFQANAQTRNRYVFDNFDTTRGVQIAQPPTTNVTIFSKDGTKDKTSTNDEYAGCRQFKRFAPTGWTIFK
jgi:hypothetical protein